MRIKSVKETVGVSFFKSEKLLEWVPFMLAFMPGKPLRLVIWAKGKTLKWDLANLSGFSQPHSRRGQSLMPRSMPRPKQSDRIQGSGKVKV